VDEVIDDLGCILELGIEHHPGQVDRGDIAGDRFHSLDGHLGTTEAAIAGIEFFVPVGILIGFGNLARFGVILGGGADIHPFADTFRNPANLAAAGVAVGRKETNVGEQNVACEIGALEQEARSNPALASSPPGYGRRRKELLPKRSGFRRFWLESWLRGSSRSPELYSTAAR